MNSLTRLLDTIKPTTPPDALSTAFEGPMRRRCLNYFVLRHRTGTHRKRCKRACSPQLASVHIAYQRGTAYESEWKMIHTRTADNPVKFRCPQSAKRVLREKTEHSTQDHYCYRKTVFSPLLPSGAYRTSFRVRASSRLARLRSAPTNLPTRNSFKSPQTTDTPARDHYHNRRMGIM